MYRCRKIILIGLLIGFIWITPAMARVKVAVFPFQDLTSEGNGVNWPLTEQLEVALEEKGLDVLSKQAVLSFMALHRIRTLGHLETYQINLAKKELGAKLILLGSVCQNKTTPPPALTLALYLVRTDDGRTIWSNVEDICCIETRNLLGLREPKTIEEISPLLSHNILSTWPANITEYTSKQKPVDIESAWLRPLFVRSGQDVQCSVHLRNPWLPSNKPMVSLKIGEKIIPTKETAGEGFYEASWPAEEADGRYPVSLLIQWPDGKTDVNLIDSYFIDNQPPELDLNIKGTELAGKTTFDGRIILIPRIHVREPILRWNILFKDNKDNIIFTQESKGFPPAQLFWRGTNNEGHQFPNGEYQVFVQLWDRAGNMAEASQWLTIKRKKPQLEIKVAVVDQELIIDLLHEKDIPVAFWQIKFRSANGVTLKVSEGNSFPAQIVFPLTAIPEADKHLGGEIILQDILGNQTTKTIKDFMTKDEEEREIKKADAWSEGF